jgi:DGQHR domain-containing protein
MEFYNLDCIKIKQFTNKDIALSAITFDVIKDIVKFTFREPQNYDPFQPYKQVNVVAEDINNEYYQRLVNDERIKKIYEYLLREISSLKQGKANTIGTFPTSIILSINVSEEFASKETYMSFFEREDPNDIIENGAYIKTNTQTSIQLILPKSKIALIVDGQHRIAGMIKLFIDAKENNIKIGRKSLSDLYPSLSNEYIIEQLMNFTFGCTLLLGFDLWEQGKVFADVNFNQKPVNKSLYYDIFGSQPSPDKNDIFLAHMLAMHLNNNSDSPIKGFIKMLGRGKGYFSQAFFVEALLNLFRPKNAWGDLPIDYIAGGTKHKILPKFLKAYFNAIKVVFSTYWPNPDENKYENILVKTTGMGALLKLIDPIYRDIKTNYDLDSIDKTELEDILIELLSKLKDNGESYFSKSGRYARGGSLGLQSGLYTEMAITLGYIRPKK